MNIEYKARYCRELTGCGGTVYATSCTSSAGIKLLKSGKASHSSCITGMVMTGFSHEYFTRSTL